MYEKGDRKAINIMFQNKDLSQWLKLFTWAIGNSPIRAASQQAKRVISGIFVPSFSHYTGF
jgi:hypothetical protein